MLKVEIWKPSNFTSIFPDPKRQIVTTQMFHKGVVLVEW